MAHVLVAHAPGEAARAALVAEKLDALGFEVRQEEDVFGPLSPFAKRKLAAQIDGAACVLVLWSREASPALRQAATRARAHGKLAMARLDATPSPLPGAANLANWGGHAQSRAWRELVQDVEALTAKPGRKPKSAGAKSTTTKGAHAPAKSSGGGMGLVFGVGVLALAAAGAAAAYFLHLF